MSPPLPVTLTAAEVRKVAKLACLELSDEQVELYRSQLSAVLASMQRLQELDLADVEPMSHPAAPSANRLDEDVPGPTLPTQTLLDMAPASYQSFIKVPKVLGGGEA